MMSTSTIDLKIGTAYKKSEALYRSKPTWEDRVNKLLDRMNDLNRLLTSFHSVLLNLSFEIERDMNGFRKSSEAPKNVKKLVALSTKMMNAIRKSDLFPGVKTTHHILKQEISYLNELVNDREISLQLDEDAEMVEIAKSTFDASRRK